MEIPENVKSAMKRSIGAAGSTETMNLEAESAGPKIAVLKAPIMNAESHPRTAAVLVMSAAK
jgi:hypothetical protein